MSACAAAYEYNNDEELFDDYRNLSLVELLNESFTVQRNSSFMFGPLAGERGCPEEQQWSISFTRCCEKASNKTWLLKIDGFCCIRMNNGRKIGHECAWIPCGPNKRNLWPTKCITPMEKEAWWKAFEKSYL